ncbi:hypothetical protein M6B38_364775 [Iris pallida]|uniref:Uncharacterized protein n=1 Tax=Iris pallida TaxID=29817 RepID=A0AAX6GIK2_IRIPA|nr:hypothetical protein M6B38_364775 [Iris pallida]
MLCFILFLNYIFLVLFNFHRSWPRTCSSFSKRPSICSLGEEEEDASAEVSPHCNEE